MNVVYQKEDILIVEEDMFDIAKAIAPDPLARGFFAKFRRAFFRAIVHYREMRCARYRRYLLKHDSHFRFDQEDRELIRARAEARENGIGPNHPDYPTRALFDKLPH